MGKKKKKQERTLESFFEKDPHQIFGEYRHKTLVVLDVEEYLESVLGLSPAEA